MLQGLLERNDKLLCCRDCLKEIITIVWCRDSPSDLIKQCAAGTSRRN